MARKKPEDKEQEKIDVQAATLVGTVRDRIIDISRNHGDWKKLPEAKQKDIAHAAEQLAKEVVRRSAGIIAGRGFKSIHTQLEQVTVKDGLKMVIKASKDSDGREELINSQGSGVTIVLSDIGAYMLNRSEPEIDADEPDMFDKKTKKPRSKKEGK